MTDVPTRSTVVASRPSLLTAGIGFLGSTIAVTVLLVALSQI
jgi:hypothetical protein